MRVLSIALMLALGACANGQAWVGQSDGNLMAANGAPDRETTTAKGNRILTYWGRNYRGDVVCTRTYVASPEGQVLNYSATGLC